MMTGDRHAVETIVCREASQKIKDLSTGDTGYDRLQLNFCQVKTKRSS